MARFRVLIYVFYMNSGGVLNETKYEEKTWTLGEKYEEILYGGVKKTKISCCSLISLNELPQLHREFPQMLSLFFNFPSFEEFIHF